MKRVLFPALLSVAAAVSVVLASGICISADETDEDEICEEGQQVIVVEDAVSFDTGYDSDELAEGYIEQKLLSGSETGYGRYDYTSGLSEYELAIYDYLVPIIGEIASGERTDTYIAIPDEVFNIRIPLSELGIEDPEHASQDDLFVAAQDKIPVRLEKIRDALKQACQFELYWLDEIGATYVNYVSKSSKGSYVVFEEMKVIFYVATDYQNGDRFTTDPSYGKAVGTAASNAAKIIKEYADLDDYHKLLAYNNKLCSLTDPDDNTTGGKNTVYGDPWQVVRIFNGDNSAKCASDGYAKAFRYLCDNSVFKSGSVYCLSLTGKYISNDYMWNVVHMDDGKNYFIDVARNDSSEDKGLNQSFFLLGASSGSVSSGYFFLMRRFSYSEKTIEFYGKDKLTVASSDYKYVNPDGKYDIFIYPVKNGSAVSSKTVAKKGTKITITPDPDDNYELNYIKVNGQKIDGNTFTMPSEQVFVEVSFSYITYEITVEVINSGSVSLNHILREGDTAIINVEPDEGYVFDHIEVDGEIIYGTSFTMPAHDVHVKIFFKEKPADGWITDPTDQSKRYYIDGEYAVGWLNIEGSWYFFDGDGIMQTGWVKDGACWYYLDGSGIMVTGWLQSDGKWYYLKPSGVMATGWNLIGGKWYYLESSGSMATGWKQISGVWYYLEPTGPMVTGWKQISGKWYLFESSGAMKTGWYKAGNTWYYLKSDGSMATGWLEIGGKWYFFYDSGSMASNTTVNGYKLGSDGAWIS